MAGGRRGRPRRRRREPNQDQRDHAAQRRIAAQFERRVARRQRRNQPINRRFVDNVQRQVDHIGRRLRAQERRQREEARAERLQRNEHLRGVRRQVEQQQQEQQRRRHQEEEDRRRAQEEEAETRRQRRQAQEHQQRRDAQNQEEHDGQSRRRRPAHDAEVCRQRHDSEQHRQQPELRPPPLHHQKTLEQIQQGIVENNGDVLHSHLDITNHPQIRDCQQAFVESVDAIVDSLRYCPNCKERYFDKTFRSDSNICNDCHLSHKKHGIYKFTAANDMDPFPLDAGATNTPAVDPSCGLRRGYPHWLPKLTVIEEMLIARVHVVMKSYILKNGQYGYRGHCLNVEQDISDIFVAAVLPYKVEELPVWIVRKFGQTGLPHDYKDFRVRQGAVRRWLLHLRKYSRHYQNAVVSADVLDSLPQDGSIAHRLRTLTEPESDAAASDSATESTGNQDDEDDDDVGPEDQQRLGPFQSGASGATAQEHQVEDTHVSRPIVPNALEEEAIRELMRERFGDAHGTAANPVAWPTAGGLVSDYDCVGIQAMAFPTLFPYGCGDVTSKDRRVEVTMTEANPHLLKYAVYDSENKVYFKPFAIHDRWANWAGDTAERHRVNGQKQVYLGKSPEDANLTEEELREIVRENGPRLKAMLGRMQMFMANINGSPAYLYKWKLQLEALMEQEGMSSIWFSLSMADNHWDDLYRALDPHILDRNFETEQERCKWKRKLVRDNPHLVDAFFFKRIDAIYKTFFSAKGLEAAWHWLRGELQGRGVYHGHGCLRLLHDPGFVRLAELVLQGRRAQRLLEHRGIQLAPTEQFDFTRTCKDTWKTPVDPNVQMTPDVVDKLKSDIRNGMEAEKIIVCFQTMLLSTNHPADAADRPCDCNSSARDKSTVFVQGDDNIHPSAKDVRELLGMLEGFELDEDSVRQDLAELLNAVQRHFHQLYCQSQAKLQQHQREQRQQQAGIPGAAANQQQPPGAGQPDTSNEACRFDFPKEINMTCRVVVTEYTVTKRSGDLEVRVKLDVMPVRNDQWLNSHMAPLMTVWRANMDIQLTIDIGKVVGYMTKYVTKTEASMTKGARRMVTRILESTVDEGQSVGCALKKVMGKLLGERTRSKQEMCHLIMSLPTCFCSHSFFNVNLRNNTNQLLLNLEQAGADDADGDQPAEQGSATKWTLMDAYQRCLERDNWLEGELFDSLQPSLPNMPFRSFAIEFTVGERGRHRNKIKQRQQRKVVIVFQPRLSSNPESPSYTDYCRFALIKYKPWAGRSPTSLWGGDEATDKEIQQAWVTHLLSYQLSPDQAPDFIRRELDEYHRDRSHETVDGDDEMDNDPFADDDDDLEPASFHEEHVPVPEEELTDPDEATIRWNRDHDWSQLRHEYDDDLDLDEVSAQYADLVKNFARHYQPTPDDGIQLNEMQQIGVDMILDLVRSSEEDGQKLGLLIGKGGTGKSTSLNSAVRILEEEHGPGCVLKLATTGMAANVIGGSTVHSRKHGLGLPVGRQKFKPLKGKALEKLQKMLRGVVLIVLDEFSMLRQKEIFYIHKILQQAAGNDLLFGGFAFVLLGDPAQIPAVMGRCLWETRPGGNEADGYGHTFYKTFFNKVVELEEVRRVVGDVDAAEFLSQLDRLQSLKWTGQDPLIAKQNEIWEDLVHHPSFLTFILNASRLPAVSQTLVEKPPMAELLANIDALRGAIRDGINTGEFAEDDVLPDEIDDQLWNTVIIHDAFKEAFLLLIVVPGARRVLDDPETAEFLGILDRLRDGDNTQQDWIHVAQTCSKHTMTPETWRERFGNEEENTYLYTTNAKVDAHNHRRLQLLQDQGQPVALIEASHTGDSQKMSPDDFMGLSCLLFLAVGAKVVMTSNVCQPAGLCNGSTGIVKDIVYEEGTTAPALPKFVWVDFGSGYTGPPFFPGDDYPDRRGWVPVHPMTASEYTLSRSEEIGYKEHTRTMLPLRLAWAWTIWKAQGQTILGKVVCELGNREAEAGLTYTAFSRVRALANFGIIGGLSFNRFTTKVREHSKVPGRKAEESRLRRLATATVERLRSLRKEKNRTMA